jgi:F0F1-type ATP synthase beta subunit
MINTVKFDTEQLPAILNALETDNGGNRLVLEVAVSASGGTVNVYQKANVSFSNTWVKVSSDALLWMVSSQQNGYISV